MLKTAYCVLTNASFLPQFDGDVIGVDRGALICLKQGISMKTALGDFDSVTEDEKKLLEKNCASLIKLNPRKDVSDSEAAVLWAKENGYERIILVTSMSGRFDHTYVNFRLVANYVCELLDEQNHVFLIHKGTCELKKMDYRYVSFFAVDHAVVSLQGFSYDLNQYELDCRNVLCLSNEILKKKGTVMTTGDLWCIQSNDRN